MDAAVNDEILRRLRGQRMRGDFAAIHTAPGTPGEVPDQAGARLVVLGPEHPHRPDAVASPALLRAAELLDQAADGAARAYRNMLVFLAADAERLDDLRRALAGDPQHADTLGETWRWLLAPGPGGFTSSQAPGRDDLAMRASRQLRAGGDLFVDFPPARLRADLDRVPLWPEGQAHVALADVWDAYARSVDLPRLRSSATLAAAIVNGVGAPDWDRETFAYAEAFDPARNRFDGLVAGHADNLVLKGSGLIVRPEAARRQLDGEPGES